MKAGLFLLLILILPGGTEQLDLPEYARKKVDKRLEEIWPGKSVSLDKITVDPATLTAINSGESKVDLYLLKDNSGNLGFLYLDLARGKFEDITYMTLFDNNLSILNVQVLIYKEDYGGEVQNRKWLKQFEGKKNGESMEFRKDVVNISGATISCKSMTENIRRISKIMTGLRTRKII